MQGNLGAQTRRLIAVTAAVLALLVANVPAHAEPGASPGHYDFHPNDLKYRYSGKHGTFAGDAVYAFQSAPGGNRLIWMLKLSPYVQHFVRGPMSCGASISGKRGYHDLHPSVPADYGWHSVITNLQLNTLYKLYAKCDFTASNGDVTSPGSVAYTVQFMMHSR